MPVGLKAWVGGLSDACSFMPIVRVCFGSLDGAGWADADCGDVGGFAGVVVVDASAQGTGLVYVPAVAGVRWARAAESAGPTLPSLGCSGVHALAAVVWCRDVPAVTGVRSSGVPALEVVVSAVTGPVVAEGPG